MLELAIGLIVGLGCTYLVLEPLVRPLAMASAATVEPDWADLDESDSPKVQALTALNEIEFDLETGKMSRQDFDLLKERYSRQALEAIAEEKEVAAAAKSQSEDPAEVAIASARKSASGACPVCDHDLPGGASFCSECGCSIFAENPHARCTTCGSTLEPGSKFCADCGAPVAVTAGSA